MTQLESCGHCGEMVTMFDGHRVYWPEGFPYVHDCPLPALKTPNEGDFCPICYALTWGGICEECIALPVAEVVKVAAKRAAQPPSKGGVDL